MARRLLLITVGSALAAACVPSATDDPFRETLQGTWSSCVSDGSSDVSERLTFSGDDIEWTVSSYGTSDGSCTGAETVASHLRGTFTLSSEFEATLRGTTVLARGLDVADSTRMFYTTVFVDEAATPRVLHLGIADPSTDRDMTSGAKRPVVLGADPLLQH